MAAGGFPSPLIKPDVPYSGIRLSDWFHHNTHESHPITSTGRRHSRYAIFALRQQPVGTNRNYSGLQTFVNDRSVALSPAHQKQGPFPPPTLLGLHGPVTLSDFRAGHPPIEDVAGATFTTPGSPAITQFPFLTCHAHYPDGSNRCTYRCLPCPCCLPRLTGGSASATSLSRPARASLTLRPVRLLPT